MYSHFLLRFTFLLLAVVFLFNSCKRKQDPNLAKEQPSSYLEQPAFDRLNQDEAKLNESLERLNENIVEIRDRSTRLKAKPRLRARVKKTKNLKNIRGLYRRGYFRQITQLSFNENQLPQLYYKALSFYNLAKRERSPRSQRILTARSKSLLKKITEHSLNVALNSRSVLWYGIINLRYARSNQSTESLLYPFSYINKKYPNTRVNNDALFYQGVVSHQRGFMDQAQSYYQNVKQSDPDDLIYDYRRNRMFVPTVIADHYLKRLAGDQFQPQNGTIETLPQKTNSVEPSDESLGEASDESLGEASFSDSDSSLSISELNSTDSSETGEPNFSESETLDTLPLNQPEEPEAPLQPEEPTVDDVYLEQKSPDDGSFSLAKDQSLAKELEVSLTQNKNDLSLSSQAKPQDELDSRKSDILEQSDLGEGPSEADFNEVPETTDGVVLDFLD